MASRPSTPGPGTPNRRGATSPSKPTRATPSKTSQRPKSGLTHSSSSESLAKKLAAERPASTTGVRTRSKAAASQAPTTSGPVTRAARSRAATLVATNASRPGTPGRRSGGETESETDGESCASASEAEREGGLGDTDDGSDTETEVTGSANGLAKGRTSPKKQPSRILRTESKDGASENVVVCVRVRPRPSSSLSDIDSDSPDTPPQAGTWLLDTSAGKISLSDKHPIIERRGTGTAESVNGSEGYEFKVDQVFPPSSDTESLYAERVSPVVRSAMDGFNGTVFAYGQTGSGKTWTMMGNPDTPGVIPRAVEEIFEVIRAEDDSREFLLRVSYLEIYNESLRDLLEPEGTAKLDIRIDKGRVQVSGLKEEVVTHPAQVLDTIAKGEKARHVGATDWNERSSRSHTIFSMTIESRERATSSNLAALAAETSGIPSSASLSNLASQTVVGTRISSLNLIDLAGSESAASDQSRRKEGAFINKSLLALGTVIAKLTERGGTAAQHIPYRDSKLTRLLQTSLGGNAKVVVICTISPDAHHAVESVSTLRFARRAKMVVTKAERGTTLDSHSALLQKYQQEILELRNRLKANEASLGDSLGHETDEERRQLDGLRDERRKAEEDIADMQLQRIRLQEQIEHLNRRILTSKSVDANVRRASLEQGVDGELQTPRSRKPRISDIGFGGSSPGGALIGLGLRSASSRTQLASIMEAVGSPRSGTVKEAALERKLDEAIQAKSNDVAARDGRIRELQGDLATLRSQLNEAKEGLERANTAASAQASRMGELEGRLQETKESLERAQEEQKQLLEEQDKTKGLNSTQAEQVKSLEAKIADLEATLDRISTEKTTSAHVSAERISSLEADVTRLEAAVAEAKSAVETTTADVRRRDADLESERKALKSLREELEGVKSAGSAQAQAKDQQAADERGRAQKEADGLKSRIAEVEALLRAAQDETKKAASDMAEATRKTREEADVAQGENRTLKAELEGAREELAAIKDQQKHSVQVAQLFASSGPNTDGLKAKLAALQKRQQASLSPQSSSASLPSPEIAVEDASRTQEVEELKVTVDEQKSRIEKLEKELADARRQATEALKADLTAPATPRRALQHSTSVKESAGAKGPGSPAAKVSAAAEAEIERLNGVIDSQRNMLSDAKTDMAKWHARVRAQAQLIAQLQEGVDEPIVLGTPLSTPTGLVRREMASPSKTKMSMPPLQATPTRSGPDSPFAFAAAAAQRALSPTGSRTGPTSPSKANDYQYRDSPYFDGSPRPLPLAPGMDDEAALRKGRRRTIDKDMEKLKQETLVERKKSVLMSPRSTPVKERRVLSGLGIRAAKMSAEDRPLAPWEEASPARGLAAGNENEEARGKKSSTDTARWYD